MVNNDGGQLSEFIDGLGPGQLVGRQVLGAPALGDIQLSLCYQKGFLEVEVIRARGLQVCICAFRTGTFFLKMFNLFNRHVPAQKYYPRHM